MGERPLAVDAGVGPEVDEDDLAAQRSKVMGFSPGVLSQAVMPVKVGRLAAAHQGRSRRAVGQLPVDETPFKASKFFLA